MQRSFLAKRLWFPVFILIAAFYLWALGSFPLVGPDEPRYAQVAREMFARGDFITPTLGGLPWFEKPALLYWMMMFSYRLFGVSEYAARFGPALCGLLTAFFVYWIGRRFSDDNEAPQHLGGGPVGEWSALVWLSSLGAITFSHGASFDIVLTMTITGAFAFFLGSVAGNRKWFLVGFYSFAGLSLLAKGLIGFIIIFGVIGLFYFIRREWPARGITKSLVWGIPLSLAVAGLWFGPILARHGWIFVDQFIVQHHFARFVSNKYHHPGPFYFYLPVLLGMALPWTVVLVAAIISTRKWRWRGPALTDRLRVLTLVWLSFPTLFFSFSGSKLIAYILPVLPAAAILAGERIVCALKEHKGDRILRMTGLMLIALTAVSNWYVYREFKLGSYCLLLMSLPLVLVGALALIRPRWRAPVFMSMALAVITTAAVAQKCAAPQLVRKESVRDLLAVAAMRGYGATPVAQLHTVERTAEFYAANRISYQADGEPVKFEGVLQVVEAARRNSGTVLCFIPIEFQSQLTSYKNAQTEVIAENGRVALFAVHVRP